VKARPHHGDTFGCAQGRLRHGEKRAHDFVSIEHLRSDKSTQGGLLRDRGSVLDFARCCWDTAHEFGMHSGTGYKRPTAAVPDMWKAKDVEAAVSEDAIPKGAWWQLFHDAELDQLEQELLQETSR